MMLLQCCASLRLPVPEDLDLVKTSSENDDLLRTLENNDELKRWPKSLPSPGLGVGCDDKSKMKAAILLFGMSRSIVKDDNRKSLNKYVRQVMTNAGVGGLTGEKADIFAHVKLGTNDRNHCVTALAELEAVDYEIEDGDGLYSDAHTEKYLGAPSCWNYRHLSADKMQHELGREYSIQQVHLLMEKHEVKKNMRYDFVMLARPDIVYRLPIPVSELNCKQAHFHRDFAAILPRKHSELMKNLFKDFYLNEHPYACGHVSEGEDVWATAVEKWNKEKPDDFTGAFCGSMWDWWKPLHE